MGVIMSFLKHWISKVISFAIIATAGLYVLGLIYKLFLQGPLHLSLLSFGRVIQNIKEPSVRNIVKAIVYFLLFVFFTSIFLFFIWILKELYVKVR